MKEVWKPVMVEHTLTLDGLPRYEVSDKGNVRLADEWSEFYGRLLRQHLMFGGEPCVWLNNGTGRGVGRIHKVKELMEEAFGESPAKRRSTGRKTTQRSERPVNKSPDVREKRQEVVWKPAETPKTVEKPKAHVERPQAPVERPQAPVEKPKVAAERPQVPVEKPKVTVERPQAPVEKPKVTIERPSVSVSAQKPVAITTEPVEPVAQIQKIESASSVEHSSRLADTAQMLREHSVRDFPAPVEHVTKTEEPVKPTAKAPIRATRTVMRDVKQVKRATSSGVVPVSGGPKFFMRGQKPVIEEAKPHEAVSTVRDVAQEESSSVGRAPRKKRAVRQLDVDGNVLNTFPSGLAAAKAVGVSQSGVSACCRGKVKTVGGFRWEFVEE